MSRKNLPMSGLPDLRSLLLGCVAFLWLSFPCLNLAAGPVTAANPPVSLPPSGADIGNAPGYNVQSYVIQGRILLATNDLASLFSRYTGTNVSLQQIIHAASDLEGKYIQQGYPAVNIVIAPKQIKDGIVTLDVFPGAVAQIIVAGNRYLYAKESFEIGEASPTGTPNLPAKTPMAAVTATNSGPRFVVQKYLVTGNTVLAPSAIATALTNISGAYGTNVSFEGIRSAELGLEGAYRERGFVTVAVGLPQQKLTNATVKLQVTEGHLFAINVRGNHYFSSNNVVRALPSLHTNMILNGQVFQAELNRANANQDRQIYPVIEPGPDPGTSDLTLNVKDRLPLHAKIELNNQSSPGTPDLRVNSSATYDNLWQQDQSVGIQYNFSPELYKTVAPPFSSIQDKGWNFYDQPEVAIYSGFYRIPLGSPKAVEDIISENPSSFGYNEATRKFNLPPPSGQPELNIYASRATIDTGLMTLSSLNLYNTNGNSLNENTVQQDLTINNDIGFRLTLPLTATANFHSALSGGLDFKTYELISYKTNIFLLNGQEIDYVANATNGTTSTDISPVPITDRRLEYLPVTLRYDAGLNGPLGNANFGLGLTANAWYSGTLTNLHNISGSTKSSGHWVTLSPSFSWNFSIYTNWMTTIRGDGQWTSEPLIANEQYGIGGVNSVRGYREGEAFGDTGWHVTFEQQTPPHVVGMVYGHTPLIVRGSLYMDYATVYLLDPQGRANNVPLWGTGVGLVASIGSHWESRFLISLPLLRTTTTQADEPFFNFSLTAQF